MARLSPESEMQNKRQAIRLAAIRLFSTRGFAGTSTRELCRAAGVTKPVLYHYFASKEGLFQQLVEEALADYGEGITRAAEAEESAEERFVAVVWNDFRFTRREPELLRLLYRVVFAGEPVVHAQTVVASAMQEMQVLLEIAHRGVSDGEWLGSPEEIALSVLGLSHIQTLRYLVGGEGRLSQAQARRCVEVALRGCAIAQAPPPRGRVAAQGQGQSKR
jgi:AcrR family transcriptional regulator